MNIELQKVKSVAFKSHDSLCFEAEIFIDGQRAGTASNDGRGGACRFHPPVLLKRLEEHAKTLPAVKKDLSAVGGREYHFLPDADYVVLDLVTGFLAAKELRRTLTTRVLLAPPAGGPVQQTRRLRQEQVKELLTDPKVAEKLGFRGHQVLNKLPFDEALALYRKGTE